MKSSKLYPSIVLTGICLVVALLLSVINMFTAPIIEARENEKANQAMLEVLPDGKNFTPLALDDTYPEAIVEAYSADGGFVFRTVGKGRNGDIVAMVGVDTEGKIVGVQIISNSESAGYREKVFDKVSGTDGEYKGQTLDTFTPFIASGSTMTSNGVADAIKASLQAFEIANGGSVDIRTPEQILNDTCNAALGTTDKAFERWFATEALTGVKNVYVSDAGIVMIVGDKYIGVNGEGEIVLSATEDGTTAEASSEDSATVEAAYALYSATKLTEIDKPAGAKSHVLKAYKTDTGNYVFDMRGAGNGINGEEWSHPSGEYIYLSVSISPDGKIIDVITTEQTESEGYGDACEKDSYTEQFKGAEADDIVITPEHTSQGSTDLGVISGSTITSNGYQKALKYAFEAFELLTAKGGND